MNMTSRPADFSKASDRLPFVKWVFETPDNMFSDPSIINYPTTNTIAIEKDGELVFFGPFHCCIVLESLAPKPGLSRLDMARVLNKFQEDIETVCRATKIKEVYFVCRDKSLADFVAHHKDPGADKPKYDEFNSPMTQWAIEHGYDGPVTRFFRMKVK
jgi:hypothetical protein